LVRVHYPHSALCHSCGLALGSSLNWTALDGSATDYGPTPEGRMDRPAPNLWVKRLYYEAMEWKGRAIELHRAPLCNFYRVVLSLVSTITRPHSPRPSSPLIIITLRPVKCRHPVPLQPDRGAQSWGPYLHPTPRQRTAGGGHLPVLLYSAGRGEGAPQRHLTPTLQPARHSGLPPTVVRRESLATPYTPLGAQRRPVYAMAQSDRWRAGGGWPDRRDPHRGRALSGRPHLRTDVLALCDLFGVSWRRPGCLQLLPHKSSVHENGRRYVHSRLSPVSIPLGL
jgi:hypothetical protein